MRNRNLYLYYADGFTVPLSDFAIPKPISEGEYGVGWIVVRADSLKSAQGLGKVCLTIGFKIGMLSYSAALDALSGGLGTDAY